MRVLLYCWGSNSEKNLHQALIEFGHDVAVCEKKCVNYIKDMELAWELIQQIQKERVDIVMSYNYFPIISSVCETSKIKYISLVYDCPHYTLFTYQAKLNCNCFWIFDQELCDILVACGVTNVNHTILPIAIDSFDNAIRQESKSIKYHADVSFVGNLYTGDLNYYDRLPKQESNQKNVVDEFIEKSVFLSGEPYLDELDVFYEKNREDLHRIGKQLDILLGNDFYIDPIEPVISRVIETKITVEERKRLFEAVAEEKVDFKFYTNSDLSDVSDALKKSNRGTVDYQTEMPLVFHHSKINLNCSLKSIHSGIPLRVLDIMACGGFVLTNEQSELYEYFDVGKDLVVYHDLQDCIQKINYYLDHEEERSNIARNGFEKVREICSYESILNTILNKSVV